MIEGQQWRLGILGGIGRMSLCHEMELSRLDPCSLGSNNALTNKLSCLLNRLDIPLTL